MKIGLGIDTGGTYTDAVIYNFNSREILSSAKSLTIREDLTIGINGALDCLPRNLLQEVKLVSLSTTLATNACVEGKGSRAVMVFLGCDADTVRKYGYEYGLPDYREMIFLEGGHNYNGEVVEEPDWDLLKERITECSHKADAFGIVQLWGIRNPEFEKKAAEIIKETTGKNVVCAHELTGELNFMRRAASTLLNAQLIPIIDGFIKAVKKSLSERNIKAPLVMVRGDGSLMSEEFARQKPVETLLSGPAASVAGGTKLSGRKDCVIVDMGGTTSDLAIVRGFRSRLAEEGAIVGNWRTGTKSIDIRTVGLGGDSLISFDSKDEITVGPVRVAPLSWLATRWPGVITDIKAISAEKKHHTRSLCEFFYLIKDVSSDPNFTEEERKIVKALKDRPLNIMRLCNTVGTTIYEINLKNLERLGVILKSALTPTDIMHLTGDYSGWNYEAAQLGVMIMAERLGMKVDELTKEIFDKVKKALYFNIVKMLIDDENPYMLGNKLDEQASELIMMGCRELDGQSGVGSSSRNRKSICCRFTTDLDLVGIGAPIHVFLPDVAKLLNTQCIVPVNASVANAVGAITGDIAAEEIVHIRPRVEGGGVNGYYCHSSFDRKEFAAYEEAVEWARQEAEKLAAREAAARGAVHIKVTTEVEDMLVKIANMPEPAEGDDKEEKTSNKFLLGTTVTARAEGTIKWM